MVQWYSSSRVKINSRWCVLLNSITIGSSIVDWVPGLHHHSFIGKKLRHNIYYNTIVVGYCSIIVVSKNQIFQIVINEFPIFLEAIVSCVCLFFSKVLIEMDEERKFAGDVTNTCEGQALDNFRNVQQCRSYCS